MTEKQNKMAHTEIRSESWIQTMLDNGGSSVDKAENGQQWWDDLWFGTDGHNLLQKKAVM